MIRDFTKMSLVAILCFMAGNAECRDMTVGIAGGKLTIDGQRTDEARDIRLQDNDLYITNLRQGVDKLTIDASGCDVHFEGMNTLKEVVVTGKVVENSSILRVTRYDVTADKVVNRWIWDASGGNYGSLGEAVKGAVDHDGFTNLGEFYSDRVNATNMQIVNSGETFNVKTVNHGGKHKTVLWESEEDCSDITFNKTKRIIVTKGKRPSSEDRRIVYIDDNSRKLLDVLQVMYGSSGGKEEEIIKFLAENPELKLREIAGKSFQKYAADKKFTKLEEYLQTPDMVHKIWRNLLQMLMYRPDLVGTVKPFMTSLGMKDSDKKYNINDDESFLKSLSDYQLKVLHQAGVIDDKKVEALGKWYLLKKWEWKKPFISGMSEKGTAALLNAIENDDVNALSPLTLGWGESVTVPVIVTSFNECDNVTMTLLQYCIMCNARKCFKVLLSIRGYISGKDDGFTTATMRSTNHEYDEWDCVALAFYFDRIDMKSDLELLGIVEEDSRPSHLEAAILSYRNDYADWIIDKMRNDNNPQLQDALNRGLFAAAKNNNIEGAELLLTDGADINATNNDGKTPLHIALENNAVEVIEFLIARGANVNPVQRHPTRPPLTIALENKMEGIARLLIARGANIGREALSIALENKMEEMAKLLIEKGANIESRALRMALKNKMEEIAMSLLLTGKIGKNDNITTEGGGSHGDTPLHLAVKYNSMKIIKWLLQQGANIKAEDYSHMTPLHLAAMGESKEIFELLLQKGADIKARGGDGATVLHYAAKGNSKEMFEFVLEKFKRSGENGDINVKDKHGATVLHYAAQADSAEVAELLLRRGLNINAKDEYGSTPLLCAAQENSKRVAELFLQRGADINAKDNRDRTPLHLALYYGSKDVAELLLQNIVDVNAKVESGGWRGRSLLHLVVWGAMNEEICIRLLDKGADVNIRSENGSTPLYYVATNSNCIDLADLLISKGANINAVNNRNETVLDGARNRQLLMFDFLQLYGAQ